MWYFAYASMVNPISLKRRDVHPLTSLPARLHGYDLKFNVFSGMANLESTPGADVHGVLHELSEVDFEKLVAIEQGYAITVVEAVPYDAALEDLGPVVANTFIAAREHLNPSPPRPSERYLKIMQHGLRHYKAHPAWVDKVAAFPCRPAPPPDQYLQFPRDGEAELRGMTLAELGAHALQLPAVFALGEKVIEVDVSTNPEARQADVLKLLMSGKDATFVICSAIYDPSLPEVTCVEDLTDVHRAWVENLLVEEYTAARFAFRQIAWLRP